jgi:hypothetical protein
MALRRIALSSLADELDELQHTTRRYDDPEPLEDLDALSDDAEACPRCGLVAPLNPETGLCNRHNPRPGRRADRDIALPAIPAESAQPAAAPEEVPEVAITSAERVKYQRPTVGGGPGTKGSPIQARHGRLNVPADIAEHIPVGTEFFVEISEEGILFKPAAMVAAAVKANLPAWAKNGSH